MRTPPQSILVRERGQEINQTTLQTSQAGSEPTQMDVTENTPQEDLPSTTCDTQGNLGNPRPFTARKYSRSKYFRQYCMEYSSI